MTMKLLVFFYHEIHKKTLFATESRGRLGRLFSFVFWPLFCRSAFTVLEVLIALSILSVMLMAIYQSFSSSLFVLNSTSNLWKAMAESQKELLKWERSKNPPPVSITQGVFTEQDAFPGGRWKLDVQDTLPLPGIPVRRVNYEISWTEGEGEYTYSADLYVKPQ